MEINPAFANRVCLPEPFIMIDAPIGQSDAIFMQQTEDMLEYGISWYIPNWDIDRISKLGTGFQYYSYTYGFAQIPEAPVLNKSISAFVLTYNNERTIELCLSSLRNCVDEIIVLDSGSTDSTYDIAKKYAAKWYSSKWPGDYSLQRNIGLELIETEWALVIDSDEFLDGRASSSIPKIISVSESMNIDIVWFARKWLAQILSFNNGSFLAASHYGHLCLWPDIQPRLFKMNTRPYYKGVIHNLLRCEQARYASLIIDESLFINHVRIISFSLEERMREVQKRNIVDPGNVHNLQLLPEKYDSNVEQDEILRKTLMHNTGR